MSLFDDWSDSKRLRPVAAEEDSEGAERVLMAAAAAGAAAPAPPAADPGRLADAVRTLPCAAHRATAKAFACTCDGVEQTAAASVRPGVRAAPVFDVQPIEWPAGVPALHSAKLLCMAAAQDTVIFATRSGSAVRLLRWSMGARRRGIEGA